MEKGITVGVFIDQTPFGVGVKVTVRQRRANGHGFHQKNLKQGRARDLSHAKAWAEKTFGPLCWIPKDKYTPEERLAWAVTTVK